MRCFFPPSNKFYACLNDRFRFTTLYAREAVTEVVCRLGHGEDLVYLDASIEGQCRECHQVQDDKQVYPIMSGKVLSRYQLNRILAVKLDG